jgi:hypothetical protein
MATDPAKINHTPGMAKLCGYKNGVLAVGRPDSRHAGAQQL